MCQWVSSIAETREWNWMPPTRRNAELFAHKKQSKQETEEWRLVELDGKK
jgi:hypothetical protein